MKLQKVSAILGLTVCLIGTQIPGNYAGNVAQAAQEEPGSISQGESQNIPAQSDEGSGSGTEGNEGSGSGTEGNEGSGSGTEGDEGSGSGTEGDEGSGSGTEGNEGSGSGTEENEGSGSGTEGNEGSGSGTEGNDGSGSGTGEIPGQDTKPVKPDTGAEPGGGTRTEVPGQPPSGSGNIKVQPRINGGEKSTASYRPSAKFLDDREKIKYNMEIPLDNMPSFITQEMIIGALKCQDETGYPASVTIAQIIQESGFGKYGPGGEEGKGLSYLAYQYNNLFGIKGTGPAGTVDMRTGEQASDGSAYMITSGFRVYNTYTECIEDRTELLKEVYKDLTFGVEDANTFAIKVGSRWATDIQYSQSLIGQMEKYDLYRLDRMTLDEFDGLLGTFVNPCPGSTLTSSFGPRSAPKAGASTYHKGIDMGTGAYHIPTYAAAAGTVTLAGEMGTAGLMVEIDHGDGLVTKYMHHDKIYVEEGQKVEKGQQIGLSGTTGNSTGNHLHFQVEEDGVAIDPSLYLGF